MWRDPDKEGQLVKQGPSPPSAYLPTHPAPLGHVMKNWKARWFVIKNDNLFYFKKKGVRPLHLHHHPSLPSSSNRPPPSSGLELTAPHFLIEKG